VLLCSVKNDNTKISMKFKVGVVAFCIATMSSVSAQEKIEIPKGKVMGKVFFNYHLDATKGAQQTSAFELTRAYLGYVYKINDKFSATVVLDAGKSSGGSDHSVFVKNAKLTYKAESWLTFSAGIIGMKQFKAQEKFWGYRYLYKSLADEYKFGTSADLGVLAAIKVNDYFKMDLLLVNGEGYKNVQDASGNTRFGANFVYTPTENWIFKTYVDAMKEIDIADVTKTTIITNVAVFAGYTIKSKFRIGAEYNLLKNGTSYKEASENKELKGLSFYATYILNSKWNLFGRYDQLSSNTLMGAMNDWNHSKDGTTMITGLEYTPTKGVKTSVNYRFTDFEDGSNKNRSLLYMNLEFFF